MEGGAKAIVENFEGAVQEQSVNNDYNLNKGTEGVLSSKAFDGKKLNKTAFEATLSKILNAKLVQKGEIPHHGLTSSMLQGAGQMLGIAGNSSH